MGRREYGQGCPFFGRNLASRFPWLVFPWQTDRCFLETDCGLGRECKRLRCQESLLGESHSE